MCGLDSIPDYKIKEKIHESAKSLIYRGYCISNDRTVILKLLNKDYPTPQEIARFSYEYELLSSLNIDGVIKVFSLESYRNGTLLVMEDCGGESLDKYLHGGMKLEVFLPLAVQLAGILGELHEQGVIHKDIKPSNIIWNPRTWQVRIIDFGMATRLASERFEAQSTDILWGTLPYISPEQTGRMNRSVDYRTDFYSLGVTYYEMLMGFLPFQAANPLELIHCHIARQPDSPHILNPKIPGPVAGIVLKLLAKMAEDRYQSMQGLKIDLAKCLDEFKQQGKINDFLIGQKDISHIFKIPEKLYGREKEIDRLLAGFEQACGTTAELLLLAGYSGIGKSALIHEIYEPVVNKGGYLISGKCDQYKQNIPYCPWLQALGRLVRLILTESKENIAIWKARMLEAVGSNGQVIIEVIPEVELILGKQPPVEELGPAEAKNRFNMVFAGFIRTLSMENHPLVIFLDDLHWADLASFKLIEQLITDSGVRHLFIIGAYRNNEIDNAHPLMFMLNERQKTGKEKQHIKIGSLDLPSITRLIVETFNCGNQEAIELATVCAKKTGGNPFFLRQFLTFLYDEKIIRLDTEQGIWCWDIKQVQNCDITDNVLDLMLQKLKNFHPNTQNVLKLAACIGSRFDLSTLALINEKPPGATAADLQEALRAGAVLPVDENYKFMHSPAVLKIRYKFLHDRVQQAAYVLIDDDIKPGLHLKIGRLLLARYREEGHEKEKIFVFLNHLNSGAGLITDREEKLELARLNLTAARKAKISTAYSNALQYVVVGMGLLEENCWEKCYELTLSLYRERVELEYLNRHFATARALISIALGQVASAIDSSVFYNLLINLHCLEAEYEQAVLAGKKALKLLGVDLAEADEWQAAAEQRVAAINKLLAGRDILEIAAGPVMEDPEKIAVVNVLTSLLPTTYYTKPLLSLLLNAMLVEFSLKFGNAPQSPTGFAAYGGHYLCGRGDYRAAYKFGLTALKLSQIFDSKTEKAGVCTLLGGFILPWVKHVKLATEILTEGYETGFASGQFEYAVYCLYDKITIFWFQGMNIEKIEDYLQQYLIIAKRTKNQLMIFLLLGTELALMNLLGRTVNKGVFASDKITEDDFGRDCDNGKMYVAQVVYLILRLQVQYMAEEFAAALESGRHAEKMLDYLHGNLMVALHNFYQSLVLAALFPGASTEEQKLYQEKITHNQEQLSKWADNCQENFLNKFLLVEAEIARLAGQNWRAAELYDQAIDLAGRNGFIQEEALANELSAEFWLGKGKEEFAQIHMKKAHQGYRLWGAGRKIDLLEAKYTYLQNDGIKQYATGMQESPFSSSSTPLMQMLDLTTIIKVANTIAGEIELAALLQKIMRIVLENAGAQRGFFIMETGGELKIEAEASEIPEQKQLVRLQSVALENSGQLSAAIVNYAARSGEYVVLRDAAREGMFTRDEYIKSNRPKSILCLPAVSEGKLAGLLYLENNLCTDAFTPERVELLRLISAQIAISVKNAHLYAKLEESKNEIAQWNQVLEQAVAERTRELEKANEHLQRAKENADEANRSKSDFLAVMSHEIRTPLSSVVGIADLLLETPLRDEQKEYASIILDSSELLLTVINDILDYSKIEDGKLQLEMINFYLPDVEKSIMAMVEPKAREKGLVLRTRFSPEIPNLLQGDPMRLRQILLNLLHNAVKFTAEGEVTLQASLAEEARDQLTVRFEVRDTGIGIPEEVGKKLFTPFTQGDLSTTRKYGGTGLGLSICKRLVELMNGAIGFASTQGKGSVFWFAVPFAPPDRAVQPAGDRYSLCAYNRATPEDRTVTGPVLLVEDYAVNRMFILTLLKKIGLAADFAGNGKEAVEAYTGGSYALILMDCLMPVMDGFEATRTIREIEARRGGKYTPVIALTASTFPGLREKCLSAGMNDYIMKPFRISDMRRVLARWLPGLKIPIGTKAVPVPENPVAGAPRGMDTVNSAVLRELLQKLDGDGCTLRQMVETYRKDMPDKLKLLREAAGRRDTAAMRLHTHGMKASSTLLGAIAFSAMCRELETLVSNGVIEGTEQIVLSLEEENKRVQKKLLEFVIYLQRE